MYDQATNLSFRRFLAFPFNLKDGKVMISIVGEVYVQFERLEAVLRKYFHFKGELDKLVLHVYDNGMGVIQINGVNYIVPLSTWDKIMIELLTVINEGVTLIS